MNERFWKYVPGPRGLGMSGVALAVVGLASCGPGHGLNLGRVQGKVTVDGRPVTYGTVFFVPDASKGTDGPPAMGTITADGTYTLSTDSPGDGALVGHHKVGVVALDPTPVNPGEAAPAPEEAPVDFMKSKAGAGHQGKGASQKAARPSPPPKSKAGGETFTDKGGRAFRMLLPKKLGNPEESGLRAEVRGGSNSIDFRLKADGTPEP